MLKRACNDAPMACTGMRIPSRLILGAYLALAPIAAARAETPPPAGDAHLIFGSACPGGLLRVVIIATPKGPKVTLTRPGRDPGPFETLDVNFAHVSRRVFFKAKTDEGLIEFQGHARKDALVGLLSDDRGETRNISLPAAGELSKVECAR